MQKTVNLFIISGVLVIIGTAGSSDLEILNIRETVLQVLSGGMLIFIGLVLKKAVIRRNKQTSKVVEFYRKAA